MRTQHHLALFAFLGAVLAAHAVGCGGSAFDNGQCGAGTRCANAGGSGPGGTTSTGTSGDGGSGAGGGGMSGCDKAPSEDASVVRDDCGVFASSSAPAGGDGTEQSPFQALADAVTNAKSTGKNRVYACAELFAESVVLDGGVSIYGGLDCKNAWSYSGKKATIAPGSGVPVTVHPGDGSSALEDLHIESASAQDHDTSSIAAIVDGATVSFARCELVAGNGGPGADGESPGGTGTSGVDGKPGGEGCMANSSQTPGADSPSLDCDDGTTLGGLGGPGAIATGGPGGSGEPSAGNPMNGGAGETTNVTCEPGDKGVNGAKGVPGGGATGVGSIDASGWKGPVAQAGSAGKRGQGGGGGGGAAGVLHCGAQLGGPSGGSGGTGGCGGKPGGGGHAGGASIGLLSAGGTVTLTDVAITTGNGGKGGAGGVGQIGGGGGLAGIAKNGACPGGFGGAGGPGGPGGGGLGGPSIGVAFQGTAPMQMMVKVATGDAGAGGLGGEGNAGAKGDDGQACAALDFGSGSCN